MRSYDVATIGGGFYGSFISYQLAQRFPDRGIALLEAEDALFTRAAQSNQGQLHLGYLYGGNPHLAADCVRSAALFEKEFGAAIDHDVVAYYAVHRDSALSLAQYRAFCAEADLPLWPADDRPPELFGPAIVAAYRTAEKTFHSGRLQEALLSRLAATGVDVLPGCGVTSIERGATAYTLRLATGAAITARVVVNTAFADINPLHRRSGLPPVPTRYDVLLHFLVELPAEYDAIGGSTVAGPYAFLSPSAYRGAHILASAEHRCVASAMDAPPGEAIDEAAVRERYQAALAACRSLIPALGQARYRGYTIGTSVKHREIATGVCSPNVVVTPDFAGLPDYHVVVAGRVSCMFDAIDPVLSAIDRLRW